MRFGIFEVRGVEVLGVGEEGIAWPREHFRKNRGRLRFYVPAVKRYIANELRKDKFGESVQGFVLVLEIADFQHWGEGAFCKPNTAPSFKHSRRDLWSFGQMDWREIQLMTLTEQFQVFSDSLRSAIARCKGARRVPKDFDVEAFAKRVDKILSKARPSGFTRRSYHRKNR